MGVVRLEAAVPRLLVFLADCVQHHLRIVDSVAHPETTAPESEPVKAAAICVYSRVDHGALHALQVCAHSTRMSTVVHLFIGETCAPNQTTYPRFFSDATSRLIVACTSH